MPSRAEISGRLLLPALELYICCDEPSADGGFAGEVGAEALDEDRPRRSSCRGRRASALCSFVDAFPIALGFSKQPEYVIVVRWWGPESLPSSCTSIRCRRRSSRGSFRYPNHGRAPEGRQVGKAIPLESKDRFTHRRPRKKLWLDRV